MREPEIVWEPREGDLPDWLEAQHNAFHDLYAGLEGHTDMFTEIMYDFLNTLTLIDEVYYYERVSLAADAAFQNLAVDGRRAMELAKKRVEQVRAVDWGQRGYAASNNNWLEEFDKHPEWLERRDNGKGWKVSAADIIKELTKIDARQIIPVRTTIDRHRKYLLK